MLPTGGISSSLFLWAGNHLCCGLCPRRENLFQHLYKLDKLAYLTVETEGKQHDEEEDGPEWRDGQTSHSLRVGDEGKTET